MRLVKRGMPTKGRAARGTLEISLRCVIFANGSRAETYNSGMKFRLRTLLILATFGPPAAALAVFAWRTYWLGWVDEESHWNKFDLALILASVVWIALFAQTWRRQAA